MSVMPASVARSIARLDGADTAADDLDPGEPGLLDDLVRGPAANSERVTGERKPAIQQ